MKTPLLFVAAIYVALWPAFAQSAKTIPNTVRVIIDKDPQFPTQPRVTFENSLFKAVLRSEVSEDGSIENGFCDWTLQSTGRDEVNYMVDACAMRPAMEKVELVKNLPHEKTVKVTYVGNSFVQCFTIFSNKPYIKVDYLKYDELNGNDWMNTVDVTEGVLADNRAYETYVYGEEKYRRGKVLYESVYWDGSGGDAPKEDPDPTDGGSLNYKQHSIMAVMHKKSGSGFARVMPFWKENERGGMRVLKLLWNRGFETFPALGNAQKFQPSFTSYLYCFDGGADNAMKIGRALVDEIAAVPNLNQCETDLFKIAYGNTPDFWGSGIINFTYKPHNTNYGYTLDTYGRGYAKYAVKMPSHSEITYQDENLTEIRRVFDDSVQVVKYDRFYKGYPVMEIHYEQFKALWWEDFFDNADTNAVLSFYKHKPLNRDDWWNRRKKAEAKCKHNFGDCFISADGEHVKGYMYKGFFVYGTHSTKTGKGIGGILLNKVALKDAWKPWWEDRKIPNFESFPFGATPFSRWIFIYENGSTGMDKTATKIIDELILTGKLRK